MYKIEKKAWGFFLTFEGLIENAEMSQWVKDAERALMGKGSKFGVLVDMRSLKPLPAESRGTMPEVQKLFKQKGMERSAVIVDSATTAIQFKRIAKETGIYGWERYINASADANWERTATDWITASVDPDMRPVPA